MSEQATNKGSAANDELSIQVATNGPYLVKGGVPLRHKDKIKSELGEPLTWKTGPVTDHSNTYALCRCGASQNKPYCDGSHAKIGFDGTETAPTNDYTDRAEASVGTGMTMYYDQSICVHAGFCGNEVTDAWKMIDDTDDTQVRGHLMAIIERCPSGALSYTLDGDVEIVAGGEADDGKADGPIEPDYPAEISTLTNAPLWVTAGIAIQRSDGERIETRNRVTLCRCGASKNKPLCDGTHKEIGFTA